MTATAANILFGYWSHDTGGFHGKQPDDEMYLRYIVERAREGRGGDNKLLFRWLQFASVEPIYRIHSDNEERRIWVFPSYEAMKQTMLFRNSIGPYIYTQVSPAFPSSISSSPSLISPLCYVLLIIFQH
jgi:alpha-glucosidase (family GH31 glycosyl hydrolase)